MFSYNYKTIKRFYIVSGLVLLFILSSFTISHSADKEYQECIAACQADYNKWEAIAKDMLGKKSFYCGITETNCWSRPVPPGQPDPCWSMCSDRQFNNDKFQQCCYESRRISSQEALDRCVAACPDKTGIKHPQQGLFTIIKQTFEKNPPLSEAQRQIIGRNSALIFRDSSNSFYAINNRGVKIPLPGSLAKGFISNQFAVLADDSFISRALSTIPLLASSEHGSIRGTINGGGDFVYLQNQPNYIWMKENGAIKNYQLGSSIYLASSEYGSYRGTINGGGDFVKVMPEKVIETPFTQITLIGTKVVVDLGFNGVTGVLVLEGQLHVKELSTNTEKHVRMGEAVLIVPGHGISDASPVSNMNVTQWWKGSDLTVAKSYISDTTYSGTWTMQDEKNKLKGTLTLHQNGSKVHGIATLERGTIRVEGNISGNELHLTFIYDNYLGLTNFLSENTARQAVGITSKVIMRAGKDPDRLEGTLYAWQTYVDSYGNITERYEGGSPEANRYNPPRGFDLVRSKETSHKGVWIEAEDEIESHILPINQRPAPNTKEINPSWRPPYFGKGCWYLAAGGEYLKYRFSVPKDGLYYVWVRDYVDRFQPKGVRKIIVEFDSRKYGVFPEVDIPAPGDKGIFGWHRIGNGLWLNAGEHIMKIIKELTTSGAAIIDAYYLTIDPNDIPPEK